MKKQILKSVNLTLGMAMALTSVQPAWAANRAPAMNSNIEEVLQEHCITNLRSALQQTPLPKIHFLGGMFVDAGYRCQVEPASNPGLVTRYDKFYFELGGAAGSERSVDFKKAGEKDFSVGLGLNKDIEIKFARQFQDMQQASDAAPYTAQNFPLDSERALKGLKVGDYFSMKAKRGVLVSGGFLIALGVQAGLDVKAHYLVLGDFEIHALRLPNDRIQLKLLSLVKSEKGVSGDISNHGTLEIFKVEVANKVITKVLDLDPIRVEYNEGTNNLFMVDYTIHLTDADESKTKETRAAYDAVLGSSTVRMIEHLKKSLPEMTEKRSVIAEEMKNALLLDLEPFDAIFQKDGGANTETGRITRNFQGNMRSDYNESKLELGIRVIRMKEDTEFSVNRIVQINNDNSKDFYRVESYLAKTEGEFLFSWSNVKKEVRMSSVMKSDVDFKDMAQEDLVIFVERQAKSDLKSQIQDLKQAMSRTLPTSLQKTIDYSGLQQDQSGRQTSVARYQIVIHPEVLNSMPQLSYGQIYNRYLDYLRSMDDVGTLFVRLQANDFKKTDSNDPVEMYLGYDVKKIARQLEVYMDRSRIAKDRMKALTELHNNRLFMKTGVRFVLDLLPQDSEALKKLIRFDLLVDAKKKGIITSSFGERQQSKIYDHMISIQNIISNDGKEMRLEGEALQLQIMKANLPAKN